MNFSIKKKWFEYKSNEVFFLFNKRYMSEAKMGSWATRNEMRKTRGKLQRTSDFTVNELKLVFHQEHFCCCCCCCCSNKHWENTMNNCNSSASRCARWSKATVLQRLQRAQQFLLPKLWRRCIGTGAGVISSRIWNIMEHPYSWVVSTVCKIHDHIWYVWVINFDKPLLYIL